MPTMMKDENGDEVEFYTKKELEDANQKAKDDALTPIKEKMGLKEGDDFDKSFDETIKKSKEFDGFEKIKGGKEKTKQEAQAKTLADLKEKGVEAEYNDKGELVVNQDKQNANDSGITIEQAEEAAKNAATQAVVDSDFKKATDVLLAGLDKEKQGDVKTYIDDLKSKGIEGDANQLFNMSTAALGVDAPKNMNTNQGGYPNGGPENNNNPDKNKAGDFADTPKGERVMKDMGMLPNEIARSKELKDKGHIVKEGRILNNTDGKVETDKDVIK